MASIRDIHKALSRRQFLKAAASLAAGSVLPGCSDSAPSDPEALERALHKLPNPEDSGIDHIIVMMMENRSFDHFLGWVPGAKGKQEGVVATGIDGVAHTSYPMTDPLRGHPSPWQGCGSADPDHGYVGGRLHLNHGKMDGWLQTAPAGDTLPLAYYRRQDLPFYAGATTDWTVCDRYHHAIIAGTWPNRFYMHAGDNDFVDGDGVEKQSHLYTVWDALAEKNLEGRYYFGNLPFVGLWRNPGYMTFSRPLEDFFADCALGNLAPVTYVDPIYESGAPNVLSNDDHPHSDVRAGQLLLNRVYDAVRSGPKWGRTLLIINYDEWGGFFEHVVPPVMPPSDADYATWQNDGRLGFRVPCLLIGPRARRGSVNHDLIEPNAILNFISWRFGLRLLGSRSQYAGNLATALNWDDEPNLDSRGYAVPVGAFGTDCERYSSDPQLNPPLPDPNPLPQPPVPLPPAAAPGDDDLHLRQMKGLWQLSKEMGFWVGPTGFE